MTVSIDKYKAVSNIDFSTKSIKKQFLKELHKHSIPETVLHLIAAKENQEYLGQYSHLSQFRNGVKVQLHIDNHFKTTEEDFLSLKSSVYGESEKPEDLTKAEIIQIAQLTQKGIMETMWHEYAHAIYEFYKESDAPEHKAIFNDINDTFDTEEDFTEELARLYAGADPLEIKHIVNLPSANQEKVLAQSINEFSQSNFFPENIAQCSNEDTLPEFIADCFLKGFEEKFTFKENDYSLKIHEAYLKNEIRIISESFENPLNIIYVNTPQNKKYPLIEISHNSGDSSKSIFIDSVSPENQLHPGKTQYSYEEIQSFRLNKNKPKI